MMQSIQLRFQRQSETLTLSKREKGRAKGGATCNFHEKAFLEF